jgi:hypothetical protein
VSARLQQIAAAGSLAAAILCASAPPANAILRRHDRPDSLYRRMALDPRYRAVVDVGGVSNGTIIDPRWVLTAAHAADAMSPFALEIQAGDRSYEVDSIRYHPRAFLDPEHWVDLALLHLVEPVRGIEPVRVARGNDGPGTLVTVVGTGMSGDGHTGPADGDGVWRAAHNRVWKADDRLLTFVFDSTNGEELEGASGPGDSGGPALIERGGKLWIAGVSSQNRNPDGSLRGKGTYGSLELYPRVSKHTAWIDSMLKGGPSPGTDWTPAQRILSNADWPADRYVSCVRDYLAAFASADSERFERFSQTWGDSVHLAEFTPAQRAERLRRHNTQVGTLAAIGWSRRLDGGLAILLRSSAMNAWLEYRFSFSGTPADPKLRKLVRARMEPAPRWRIGG